MSKARRKDTEQQINKATSAGDKTIGVISYWSLDGVFIRVEDLRALYAKHNLDPKWFPPTIQGSAAFRKALQAAKRGRDGYIMRPIVEDEKRIVWGVVREDVDKKAADLELTCEAKVAFNKTTESVHIKGKPGSDAYALAERVQAAYADLTETFVAVDIQRVLKRNMENMGSVTLRRSGGFYFSPPDCLPLLEAHQRVIEEIGSSDMGLIVVAEGSHNTRTIGRDARRSLEDDLNQLTEEIEAWKTKPPRHDTLGRRLEEFKAMRSKYQLYSNILNIKVQDLNEGINDCEQQVRQILGAKPPTKRQQRAQRSEARKAAEEAKAKAKIRRLRRVAKK